MRDRLRAVMVVVLGAVIFFVRMLPPALADGGPVNTVLPSITGTAQDGQTLTTDQGTWTFQGSISYADQWLRCDVNGLNCSNIDGATGQTYIATSPDVGSRLEVTVTATDSTGSGQATSGATGVVQALPPANQTPPAISGTAQDGATFSATTGTWTGSQPLTFSYQWQRCTTTGSPCVDIGGATGSTYALSDPDVGTTMRVRVTADNSSLPGGRSANATSTQSPVVAPGTFPPNDPVVAAAGDIACDPSDPNFRGGNGTKAKCAMKATSDLLVGGTLSAVFALGDTQYECGGAAAYAASYGPSWGRVKAITYPVPGDHEYLTSGGTDCDRSAKAGGYFGYFGTSFGSSGNAALGYYSFDLGAWHIVALNTNCNKIGGCGVGSAQEKWLKADLAAHPNSCTLAFWHHQRFSSNSSDMAYAPFWNDLIAAGAEIVLNGNQHNYERFAPQTTGGAYDPSRGLREFIVGTGGRSLGGFTGGTPAPTSEAHGKTFGVLQLTLHATSYSWQFLPVAGSSLNDSGTTFCH